jgi:hypothetical protein
MPTTSPISIVGKIFQSLLSGPKTKRMLVKCFADAERGGYEKLQKYLKILETEKAVVVMGFVSDEITDPIFCLRSETLTASVTHSSGKEWNLYKPKSPSRGQELLGEFLTQKELADLTGKSPTTIHRLLTLGKSAAQIVTGLHVPTSEDVREAIKKLEKKKLEAKKTTPVSKVPTERIRVPNSIFELGSSC